jgi:adenine-specific DNA-methyltransferase
MMVLVTFKQQNQYIQYNYKGEIMRYIGNKTKLLQFIENTIKEFEPSLEDKVFCDLFSGTATVAKHFKSKCAKIISNDYEQYSFILQRNYIGNTKDEDFAGLIERYNKVAGLHGPLTEALSPGGKEGRMFFTEYNAKKIDGIRDRLEKEKSSGIINDNQYYFLLCSLLESADSHGNTTGVYGAFLKKFNTRASGKLVLKAYQPELCNTKSKIFKGDSNVIIKNISGDILYLDPPYNNRQYSSNYHVLNYICDPNSINIKLNKQNQESKTALGTYNISKYSRKAEALKTFEELIANSSFKKIFVSYNDEGIMSLEEVKSVLEKYGAYHLRTKKHKRYKSNKETVNKNVIEYIHILIKEEQ